MAIDLDNGVYQISIEDLIRADPRWDVVKTEFINSCTKPSLCMLQNLEVSQNEKNLYEESQLFPESFEKVDERERNCRKLGIGLESGRSTATKSVNWSWHCGQWTKHINSLKTSENYKIFHKNMKEIMGQNVTIRGIFYYPPHQGFREWHSNKYDVCGWRLYLVRSNGDSFFNYIDKKTKEMKCLHDGDIVLNMFKVGEGDETLYHSVVSKTADRWSTGFLCDESKVIELLKLHNIDHK